MNDVAKIVFRREADRSRSARETHSLIGSDRPSRFYRLQMRLWALRYRREVALNGKSDASENMLSVAIGYRDQHTWREAA